MNLAFWRSVPREDPILRQPSVFGMAALEVALGELGQGETTGQNEGSDLDKYRGRGPGGPWCAAFVYWCILRAWSTAYEPSWGVASGPCPIARTHSARRLFARVAAAGSRVTEPLPGDVVLWSRGTAGWQGHVGIVASVTAGAFESVEGNRGGFPSKVRRYQHELGEDRLIGFARLP